ncbi:hypothetical protein F5890DRAFT_1559498 [Lentinula detonsa]|uniref:Zn(2)-C6 fungal-type domain-containing protein n=1 Tax=Lentinula detonsa TaxID=2804962 RepID=A0AA38PPG5_9AGAR|nr:hypothetical protein F5890DRAFT_1559498 [Lentinula detonsa]
MSSSQHATVAGTPAPAKPSQIVDDDMVGSGDEEEERAALLQKLALLDKQQEEKKAKKKAEAERKIREEQEKKAREEAEKKAREESEKKAREEAEKKAREEAEKKARESEKKAREEAKKKAQAEKKIRDAEQRAREEQETKTREDAKVASRERHAAIRQERERKLREAAAAVVTKTRSSVISSVRSEDEDRGEEPSHKRSRSNGPGSNVPDVVISKKRKQATPINVDEIEDNINSDDMMEKRGPCDNCKKKQLRCFPQTRTGPNSACAPCNKSKLGCSWVHKKTNQTKPEKARTLSLVPDNSHIVPDLLRTIIRQNEELLHYNKEILDQIKFFNQNVTFVQGEGKDTEKGEDAGEGEVPHDDLLDFGDFINTL